MTFFTHMHKKNKIILIGVLCLLLLVVSMLSFVTYVKFNTINFPKVAISLSSITFGEKTYVELKNQPNRVILATSKDSLQVFTDFLINEGYTIIEKLGSLHVIEKNGNKEYVHFSVNGYYSKWVWNKSP